MVSEVGYMDAQNLSIFVDIYIYTYWEAFEYTALLSVKVMLFPKVDQRRAV